MTDFKEQARLQRMHQRQFLSAARKAAQPRDQRDPELDKAVAAFIQAHVRVSADQTNGLTSTELYERFKAVGGWVPGRRGNVVAVALRKAVAGLPGVTLDASMTLWGVRLPIAGSLAWSERMTD